MTRGRRILFSILTAVLGLASVLAGIEAAGYLVLARCYGPYRDAVVRYLESGQAPQPEWLPDSLYHHHLNPRLALNDVNRWGTRGPDFSLERGPGELRIVSVGDSTTQGLTLPADQSYPAFLGRFLSELLGRPVTSVNGGVASHNSAFNLARLGLELIHLHPDVVVIKSSYNDYVFFQSSGSHRYFPPVFCFHPLPEPPPAWARWSQWGRVWYASRLDANQESFGGRIPADTPWQAGPVPVSIYAEQLRGMVGIARANGAEPVLLDLPLATAGAYSGRGGTFRSLVGRFNRELERVALDLHVPLVRTQGALGVNDFWDECHNTSQGHQRIAALLAREIGRTRGGRGHWRELPPSELRILQRSGGRSVENDPSTLLDPAPTGYVAFSTVDESPYLVIDLGRLVERGLLILSWTAREESGAGCKVSCSRDRSTWVLAAASSSYPEGATTVALRAARYLRLEPASRPGAKLMLRRINAWEQVAGS